MKCGYFKFTKTVRLSRDYFTFGQFCAPGYGPIAESAKQTCPFTWDSLNMFSTRAEEAKPF
jgi:hypothetical protein